MPTGNQIVLGFQYNRWDVIRQLTERLGMPWHEPADVGHPDTPADTGNNADDDPDDVFTSRVVQPIYERLQDVLIETHLRIARERFGAAYLIEDGIWRPWYYNTPGRLRILARTPGGVRKFCPFHFYCFGCRFSEVGDRWPDDYVCGIALSQWANPAWLDWEDEFGGI